MVLEQLALRDKPYLKFFLVGAIYFSIALFLGLWKFSNHVGLFSVFFTVLAAVPFFYDAIKNEEQVDVEILSERKAMLSHSRALTYFMLFFLGVMVSVSFWYLVLPSVIVGVSFIPQISAIGSINPSLVGGFSMKSPLMNIFLHNLEILSLCVAFSFIYGIGAIFILTWNATVLGTAMGSFVKLQLTEIASPSLVHYISAYWSSVLRFLLHGVFEILAFFAAGLAGGIISVAVIRHHITTKRAHSIIIDSGYLILISIGLLFLGALIEVYITPLFFA